MSESGRVSVGDSDNRETYSHRGSTAATDVMAERTANEHAAFLLPHLQQGMRLLDAGCGPGTITLDLAKWVAPGEVVGIDRGPEQIEAARQHAAQQQAKQVCFEVADICALPFPDNSFDAVYCNGVAHYRTDSSSSRGGS